ncbi:Hypothetical_protein [Hexamita inflata]|uniref:Hypothetical_protein n=1 Tax=Hexamita inflata TaxID=28002 RepID=A0AA86PSR6_9EUKA|nr:Hypothetical protein HINF_LOCUS18637 [Hexamita inflata]CAI9945494.1 Hypothetical protein HINF_LOCUS33139 [Hexamita inflata]
MTKLTQIIPLSQFKQQFKHALMIVMKELNTTVDQITDRQRCQYLINYFQSHNQNLFWEKVQNIIPYKTKLQLKQYFQKSFSQCQYEEISDDHKNRIRELTREMPNSKPSEIVDAFFAEIGEEVYFRRKVIMFISYLQRRM